MQQRQERRTSADKHPRQTWVRSRHARSGYRYRLIIDVCATMRRSPSFGYVCWFGTHQHYDLKCRRTSQWPLSICRVCFIRSHRSEASSRRVLSGAEAVSMPEDPVAASSALCSHAVRMLTDIQGLRCPIGPTDTRYLLGS